MQGTESERVELLALGEAMGWPRVGYGRNAKDERLSIRSGRMAWERFLRQRPVPRGQVGFRSALRVARAMYALRGQVTRARVTVEAPDLLDEVALPSVTRDEPVTPKRSPAAERQARYRARKAASA